MMLKMTIKHLWVKNFSLKNQLKYKFHQWRFAYLVIPENLNFLQQVWIEVDRKFI